MEKKNNLCDKNNKLLFLKCQVQQANATGIWFYLGVGDLIGLIVFGIFIIYLLIIFCCCCFKRIKEKIVDLNRPREGEGFELR